MTRTSRARRDLLVLFSYFTLALVLTYPLVLHLTTHVVGDGSDDPALAWNLWWVPHALFDLGRSPIYTDYMFYPIGANLAFYTLTYLNAFISIPIQFVFGIIPAVNLNLLLSFTLSGFGTYLLVRYLLRGEAGPTNWPAFAAGLLYAFSSNKFLYASLGQFNIASSQWIPFYILFLLKLFPLPTHTESLTPPRSWRYGLLLGLFLLFQALAEFIFASFLILLTIVYLVYWLAAHRFAIRNTLARRSAAKTPGRAQFAIPNSQFLISNSLVASLTFLLPMSPILVAMFSDMQTEGDFIQSGLGFSNVFSGDLLGFFIPSHLHPLFGGIESQFHFAYINFVYLGFVALALALLALWRVPRARIWGLAFALVLLVTLGPTLRINGAEYNLFFLPFNLLLQIPLVKGNRYPSRWSVMLTLFLAILVAYGLRWLLMRLQSKFGNSPFALRVSHSLVPVCSFGIAALLLLEHVSVPLPLSDFRIPAVYQTIAQDTGDFAVMELPLSWRNGFRVTGSYRPDSQGPIDREFMLAQWYQTAQQHPILNGNTSRNPELKFQYFAETPALDSLIAVQTGHAVDDATRARDKELAPRVLQFLDIRYIVWHTPADDANRDVANRTRAYIEQTWPVTKISESYENGQGTALYRVDDLPIIDRIDIKPNDPLARLYFGEGWSAVGQDTISAERDEARILFPLTQARDLTLSISTPGLASPDFGLTVNGHAIPESSAPGVKTIPTSLLHMGVNELLLRMYQFLPPVPADSASARLPIGQTGVSSPDTILVRSAGEEQGNFGHIYVNGVDESSNGRGYNFVVINPQSGKVESRANFDLLASPDNSARLAKFIAGIPNGEIVAAAVADEASMNLKEDAVYALKTLGGQVDLRGKFRWSHALIGVKGAPPGSALEAAFETRVSQLAVGLAATSPQVGPSLSEITIQPAN